MLQAIETIYNGWRFRSRTEAKWAVVLDNLGLAYDYEVEGYNLNGTLYLPDFLVGGKSFIEIKGQAPTTEEENKCRLLHEISGKRVALCYGQPSTSDGNAILFGGKDPHTWCHKTVLVLYTGNYALAYPFVRKALDLGRMARFEHGEQPYIDSSIAIGLESAIKKMENEKMEREIEKIMNPRCAFCSKSKSEVKLIGGPHTYTCYQCISKYQ